MNYSLKKLEKEFLWILFSLGISFILYFIAIKSSFKHDNNIEFHLHDTYLIIPKWILFSVIVVLCTFILYLFKIRFKTERSGFSYCVIMLTGLFIIFGITFSIKYLTTFHLQNWTLYPPLSGLGPNKISDLQPNSVFETISNILIFVQLITCIVLFVITYQWGKLSKLKI